MAEIAGFLAIIAIFVTPVGIGLCYDLIAYPAARDSLMLIILSPLLVAFGLVMIREDSSGQKYNPVLFDKASGQVHVMDTKPLTWPQFFLMPWKAAGDQDHQL